MWRSGTRTAIAILGATAAILTGCGNNGSNDATENTQVSSGEPRTGGTLIRRIDSECKTLNWVLATTVYEDYVLRNLYDPLIEINEKMEYTPVLAKGIEISDDKLRITMKLRDDIHWHDGVPITAADVKFYDGQDSRSGSPRIEQVWIL